MSNNEKGITAENEITELVNRARLAAAAIENYSQEETDTLVTSIGWSVIQIEKELARMTVDEGGFGNYDDKIAKIHNRVCGTLDYISDLKTVGVVEDIPEKGLSKIAKPVGVVAALVPTTGPDATPPVKAICALKGRNAIIFSPHPRTKKSSSLVVEAMRRGCVKVGAPADLILTIENPSISKTQLLMSQADLVVATGGNAMVNAAYSSGTPAYGVGVGNSVHVVDETSDLDDAAAAIATAKTFDYATSCLADNSVVAESTIYTSLRDKLVDNGGYVCNNHEKEKLEKALWPDGGHIPTIDVIAKPVSQIAKLAGIDIPDNRTFLIVEEEGTGQGFPFSGEKLSVVLTLYKYENNFNNAIALVNDITGYQGLGHTCGIHSNNEANIKALAFGTKTARVMVNQNLNEGAGSPRNALPYTLSLSCGTWGGNITTENVNARHFVNLTWVCRPIEPRLISEENIFKDYLQKYGES